MTSTTYPPRTSTQGSSAPSLANPYTEIAAGLNIPGLYNDSVQSLTWRNIAATIPAAGSRPPKKLLDNVSGRAVAGELVAIMGPSGSGKTMLLDRLAHRSIPPKANLSGEILLNNTAASTLHVRQTSSYVEQEDQLIGSLTAAETVGFAAKLGLNETISRAQLRSRVATILAAFGLQDQSNTIIGTPIQKGLSGGQKRRVSVASQLVTSPKLLFLDEPTSGLDSVASHEVISYLKGVAKANNLIVIASIHQPSTKTFNLFDSVYLMSKGQVCYGGRRANMAEYFHSIGLSMPRHTNPAEWILELVDTNFARDREEAQCRLEHLTTSWRAATYNSYAGTESKRDGWSLPNVSNNRKFRQPFHLLHRNFIKSYRDLIAYWVRVVMYTGLAILMGTTWLRLGYSQDDINPRITALFFSGAFLSFMAVAYIPAYIEDQATFSKERANGLCGPSSFLIANFLIGLPYLFIIVATFSVISYWMMGLWPTATGFWTFLGFLFLDLMAAESLVILVASLVPNFIVSLALVAFANGLWMAVSGFLVPETILNVFWKSWVTKIDYQNWTFRAMMWNEFHNQTFACGASSCSFPSSDGKEIAGRQVLQYYGYDQGDLGAYAGYMVAIIVVYRALAWFALRYRR